jgi:hypothetical protein
LQVPIVIIEVHGKNHILRNPFIVWLKCISHAVVFTSCCPLLP